MLGNQSLSGLDINKHPSNCLIFFLIPPSQLALTNKATTIRIEQWYHLKKKNPGEVELIAWHSPCEPEENTVVWGGLCLCLGRSSLICFFSPFLPSISLSFPLAEERAVVDGDIITQWGICGQFPVIWSSASIITHFSLLFLCILHFTARSSLFFLCSNYLFCGLPDATITEVVWILMETFLCKYTLTRAQLVRTT